MTPNLCQKSKCIKKLILLQRKLTMNFKKKGWEEVR